MKIVLIALLGVLSQTESGVKREIRNIKNINSLINLPYKEDVLFSFSPIPPVFSRVPLMAPLTEDKFFVQKLSSEFIVDHSVKYTANIAHQYLSDIIECGSKIFIAWADERYAPGVKDIYGAFFSYDGVLLDSSSIPIATSRGETEYEDVSVRLAYSGENILAVYLNGQYYYGYDVEGIIIDTNGNPLTPTLLLDAKPATRVDVSRPDVIFDGNRYFVVWSREGTVKGLRISKNGIFLDPAGGFQIGTGDIPKVVFDGRKYIVVYAEPDPGQDSVIFKCAFVDTQGSIIQEQTLTPWLDGYIYFFDIVIHNSKIYLFANVEDIFVKSGWVGVVIDTAGNEVIPFTTIIPFPTSGVSHWWEPSVDFDGTNFLLAYEEWTSTDINIKGALIDTNINSVLTDISISEKENTQARPVVLFHNGKYIVIWEDIRNSYSGYDIYMTEVATDGTVLDLQGKLISRSGNEQYWPHIVFNGIDNFFGVWHDYRNNNWDIFGARINKDGYLIDTFAFPVSELPNQQIFPRVTFDGTNYFVVWNDSRYGQWDVFGARVSQNGDVLDPFGILIYQSGDNEFYSDVAFDGTNYFVVFGHYNGTDYDIYGVRVDRNGNVIDNTPIIISDAPYDQYKPVVVFTGSYYFVAWSDMRSGSNYADIYIARVLPDGTVLDTTGIPITTATWTQEAPALAFDGINVFVVWHDMSYTGQYWIIDIYGARISQDGTVLDPSGIKISSGGWDRFPSVTFDGQNYVVSWIGFTDYIDFNDIKAALVDTAGNVLTEFTLAGGTENRGGPPTLSHGPSRSSQILFLYSSQIVDSVSNRPIFTARIKARFLYPSDNTPPSIPVLISPANDSVVNSYTVTFVWHPSGDAGSGIRNYIIEYANNINFYNSIIRETQDTSWTETIALADTMYYWHVKAVDNAGNESAWSEVRRFYISGVSVSENTDLPYRFNITLQPVSEGINFIFEIPKRSDLKIKFFDVMGRNIGSVNFKDLLGVHSFIFKKKKGIYFYEIQSQYEKRKGKFVIVR